MTFSICRGPLPAGHPKHGVIYFCVDADVPLAASGLRTTPVLATFQFTDKVAVLLDAHRAPDEWFATACSMPNIILQGDPEAFRPKGSVLFANELMKCDQEDYAQRTKPLLRCMPTLSASVPLAKGKYVVLCGSFEVRDAVYKFLRSDGLQEGDAVMDRYGRYTWINKKMHGSLLAVDGGRRILKQHLCSQHLTISPSNIRSGEYDTVIVMPDVPEHLAKSVCRRTRYMIVAVNHSPLAYVS